MSVVEAVRLGCHPLLPNRLSYPELIPPEFHAGCLYEDAADLVERLAGVLSRARQGASRGTGRGAGGSTLRQGLSASMECFAWERVVGGFDDAIDSLA